MADMIRCPNCGYYTGQIIRAMPLWHAIILGIVPGMIVSLIFFVPYSIIDNLIHLNNPYYQGNGYLCNTCRNKWIV
jgi:hypothetical protein